MNEKRLPANEQAERAVLGSILIDGAAYYEVEHVLAIEDFAVHAHRAIYRAMRELASKRMTIDLITVSDELMEHENIDFYSLENMVAEMPTSSHAVHYARLVGRCAKMRALLKAAGQIAAYAYEQVEDAEMLAETAILEATRTREHGRKEPRLLGDLLPEYMRQLDALHDPEASTDQFVPTGYTELDGILGKLVPGDLYVPAARTNVGKSALVQNIAYNAALQGKRVGFWSLEMPLIRLIDRFFGISRSARTQALSTPGRLSYGEWDGIVRSLDDLQSLGIYLAHTPGMYISDFEREASRLVRRENLDLVIVDYCQLLKARDGQGKRITPREMEVAEIMRELKRIAGELEVPILAPAQVNREIESRAAHRDESTGLQFKMPQLSDLRESGEIEQSADVVLFLARAEVREQFIKVIIGKARNGPRGEMLLYFEGEYTRFREVESSDFH